MAQTLGLDANQLKQAFEEVRAASTLPQGPEEAVRAVADKLGLDPTRLRKEADRFLGSRQDGQARAGELEPGMEESAFTGLARVLKLEKSDLQQAFLDALQQMMALTRTEAGASKSSFLELVSEKLGVKTSTLANALQLSGPQLVDRWA